MHETQSDNAQRLIGENKQQTPRNKECRNSKYHKDIFCRDRYTGGERRKHQCKYRDEKCQVKNVNSCLIGGCAFMVHPLVSCIRVSDYPTVCKSPLVSILEILIFATIFVNAHF